MKTTKSPKKTTASAPPKGPLGIPLKAAARAAPRTTLDPEDMAIARRMRGIPPHAAGEPPPEDPKARRRKLEGLNAALKEPFSRGGWDTLVTLFCDWTEQEGREDALAALHGAFDAWVRTGARVPKSRVAHLTGLWRATSLDTEVGEWDGEAPEGRRRPAQPLHARASRRAPTGSQITDVEDSFRLSREGGLFCFLEVHADGSYREVDLSLGTLQFAVTTCFDLDHGTCLSEHPNPDDLESHREALPDHPGLVCAMPGYDGDLDACEGCPYLFVDARGFSLVQDIKPFRRGWTSLDLREGETGGGLLWDAVRSARAGRLEREAYLRWDGMHCQYRRFTYELVAVLDGST